MPAGSSSERPARMPGPSTARNAAMRRRLTVSSAGSARRRRRVLLLRATAVRCLDSRTACSADGDGESRQQLRDGLGLELLEALALRVEQQRPGRGARNVQAIDCEQLRLDPRGQAHEAQAPQHALRRPPRRRRRRAGAPSACSTTSPTRMTRLPSRSTICRSKSASRSQTASIAIGARRRRDAAGLPAV